MSDDGAGKASTDRQAVGEQRANELTNERASREQTADGANLLSFAAVSEQQRSLFLPFFLDRPGRKRRLAAGGPEWLSARLQMGRCKLTWDMASSCSCEGVARQDGARRWVSVDAAANVLWVSGLCGPGLGGGAGEQHGMTREAMRWGMDAMRTGRTEYQRQSPLSWGG